MAFSCERGDVGDAEAPVQQLPNFMTLASHGTANNNELGIVDPASEENHDEPVQENCSRQPHPTIRAISTTEGKNSLS